MTITVEEIKNIVETLAILTGAIWALYHFGLFRERFPSMEIINGINYVGENSDEYLLELYCVVENKGKVRKWIAPLDFELLHLSASNKFERNKELNWQIQMDSLLTTHNYPIGKRYWVSPDWHIPFVDGESKKRFHYLTAIPKTSDFLSLYTRFIDFNSKKKAVDFILSGQVKSKFGDKVWNSKTFEERVEIVKNIKTDFYYTQITESIESIKSGNSKEETIAKSSRKKNVS